MGLNASPRVLWIDDDKSLGDATIPLLQLSGYEVTAAETGQIGLDLAIAVSPDAIILDLRLPDIHGLKVLEHVRVRCEVPVIVLTGYAEAESLLAAARLGASACMEKPADAHELSDTLRTLLRRNTEDHVPADTDSVLSMLQEPHLSLETFLQCAVALRTCHTKVAPQRSNRGMRMRSPHTQHPATQHALELMTVRPRWRSGTDIAKDVGLTRTHFARVVKKDTGLTYGELRQAILMRAGARSVLTTSEQVSQIAYALGFRHPSAFNRVFRMTFGLSPGELRQAHQSTRQRR